MLGVGPSADALERLARSGGIPVVWVGRGDARLAEVLERLRTDVFVMATFPTVVGPTSLAVPRLASLNIHPSLLPRHRGPNPYFWLYHCDDRTAGVCVHRATSRVDAGPVLARSALPLARGCPVSRLQAELSGLAGPMLRSVLHDLASGTAHDEPQDDALFTTAPRVRPSGQRVDFFTWPTERVWHFLHGLCPKYKEDLRGEEGAAVAYGGVGGWRAEKHGTLPGTVTRTAGGWLLWCTDGCVELHESVVA